MLWTQLIEKRDAELAKRLSLGRVSASRRGDKLDVRLHADRLLTRQEFKIVRDALVGGFPGVQVHVSVSYPALSEDLRGDISRYAGFLSELLTDAFPGATPYIAWEDAKYSLEGGKLHFRVLDRIGASYLSKQGVDLYLSKLLKDLFGMDIAVHVEVEGDEEERMREIAEKRLQEQERLVEVAKAVQKAESAKKPVAAAVLLGRAITGPAVPISELTDDAGVVILEGELIKFEIRDVRDGATKILSFALTDHTASVACKAFLSSRGREGEENLKESADAMAAYCKPGAYVKVKGEYQFDSYQKEMVLRVRDMVRAEAPKREDTAEQKRIELHLHTQMSAMDACASPTELIHQAAAWGHEAIAITDHGVVQAFPEAFSAAKKAGIKFIPGCEAYMSDDFAQIVVNPDGRTLENARFVVFDVETTGLNPALDQIIEIGAVAVEGGEEVDSFSALVDPKRPLPEKIVELTGITDAMLAGRPPIDEVAREFAAFIQGAVLVAHNADFDRGFIERAFSAAGLALDAPVLDTLALSRNLMRNQRSHKLGALCKHFKISLKNAHRAVHDARATGEVLKRLLGEAISRHGIERLDELNRAFGGNAAGGSKHVILLAATQRGMANLNRLVSEAHLKYFYHTPRMPKGLIETWREGLIVGSACESGEVFRAALNGKSDGELKKIASFYDFLEIQPVDNNEFLVREGRVKDREALREINRRILRIADEMNIPCVATGDVHFKEPQDGIYRAVLMAAKGFEDADFQPPLYFRTTDEMLSEFEYLGEADARRVVVDAPRRIAERIGEVSLFIPHPQGKETFQPFWPEAADDIRSLSEARARALYGDELPPVVRARMDKELKAIIGYEFATLYDIAVKLVARSLEDGYIVGSRGSIGSSFIAFLTGITEVNALPPHYRCPACHYVRFDVPEGYACGPDLPMMSCPDCGGVLDRDGFDIPFEVFLGFEGDKVPDIDLNFSGEYQPRAHAYVKELFGEGNVFRAGTIGTVAEKTAYGYVMKYLEERGRTAPPVEIERIARGMTGVKRTTGQHPAGMVILPKDYEIYQFTALQRPADDQDSETITTHYDFGSMHDVLVKLDILGHDDPTMLRRLQELTGIAPMDVPLYDPEIYAKILSLFQSPDALGISKEALGAPTGTLGIPEFGTKFVRQMLVETRPSSMEELLRISGLSHGTDVWVGNVRDIVKSGTASLLESICTRDDIMNQLIKWHVPDKIAFDTMESVRKGKGLTSQMEAAMLAANTPDWYIKCCKKIKYMFPKAHAAAYVLMALRIAYFKIYYPIEYYACFFMRNEAAFDGAKMIVGLDTLRARLEEIDALERDERARKDDEYALIEVLIEMNLRGIKLRPISLYESDPVKFKIVSRTEILPPFTALSGLGESVAQKLVQVRAEGPFISREDMVRRKVPKSVVEMLAANGCLEGMPETSQVSLFEV